MRAPDEAALRETLAQIGVHDATAVDATISARSALRAPVSPPSYSSLPLLATTRGGEGDSTFDLSVISLLGEGGMGRVELAHQRSLAREVAVKTIRPDRATPDSIALLVEEARITGSLEHPNIVPVHALARTEAGAPVMVMKRVEGVPWRGLLRDPNHPAWPRKGGDRMWRHLEILTQLANAVEFAHRRGVVHRDLKPDNVMVGRFGEVYVLDWGLAARLDGEGRVRGGAPVGTPAYMAPEMLLDAEATPRSDVFLLGAMLHEVLTGQTRHVGATVWDVVAAAAQPRKVSYGAGVPAELGAIANRATAEDPAERHPSAEAFREAIEDFLQHRVSLELGEEGAARLAELDALCVGPATGTDDGVARVRKVGAEGRFAFRLALREWAQNPTAREGLQRCLERMVEFELARGAADAAEVLLLELPEPRPALARQLAERKRSQEEDRAARVELDRRRHEADAQVHAGRRRSAMAVVTLVLLGALGLVASLPAVRVAGAFLAVQATMLGLMLVMSLGIDRRVVFANHFNRTFGAATLSSTSLMVALLLLGRHSGTALPTVLAEWALSMIAASGLLGLTFDPAFFRLALVWLVGTAAFLAWPAAAIGIYAIGFVVGTASLALAWRDRGRRQAAPAS